MAVPTLHIWCENWTLNRMKETKAKVFWSDVGYDHKSNEEIRN